ncbi:ATP-binding protein [Flavobacterium sp. '19STA2R22 D10 B1']|uniref:ATP-binding protein n=1 Tax=Flavobacterium aerium TaxID=3037261 RepID=UPI00278C1A4B|nr:ATP-binding protein [Flavobacterium sp. '19STA2R22 D10 B1']
MIKVPRVYSYEDVEKIKFKTIKITDEWKNHLGEPQQGNSHWLVYGGSGHGKTSYVLQVVKQICSNNQKVHYNTSEEGMKKGFQMALKRNNMKGVSGFNFQMETIPELTARLSQKRQAKIVVIDSVQYFFRKMRSEHYFEFINQFKDTTFIWISGADGKKPKGKIADDIYYDADIVINVDNYNAIVEKNRFEAYENKVIWQQGYDERMSKILQKG